MFFFWNSLIWHLFQTCNWEVQTQGLESQSIYYVDIYYLLIQLDLVLEGTASKHLKIIFQHSDLSESWVSTGHLTLRGFLSMNLQQYL